MPKIAGVPRPLVIGMNVAEMGDKFHYFYDYNHLKW
jgi:hypothetical protein